MQDIGSTNSKFRGFSVCLHSYYPLGEYPSEIDFVNCRFTLNDVNGKPYCTTETHTWDFDLRKYGDADGRDELMRDLCEEYRDTSKKLQINLMDESTFQSQKARFMSDDTLTIICDLCMIYHPRFQETDKTSPVEVPEDNTLADYGNLLESGIDTDFTITVDDKEFKVHKVILAARSSVFRAMFNHFMEENNSSKMELTDIDAASMEEFLKFIYTGECSLSSHLKDEGTDKVVDQNLAIELLRAADKYDMDRLKSICESALVDCLSMESVIKLLIIADQYRADQMKSHAINYMITKASDVTNVEGWDDMFVKHPRLASQVFKALADFKK